MTRAILSLRKRMIRWVAGDKIPVLLNLPPVYVSARWMRSVPPVSVVGKGILRLRSYRPRNADSRPGAGDITPQGDHPKLLHSWGPATGYGHQKL